MNPNERQSRSHGVQFALTVLACLLLVVVYVAAMRALLEASVIGPETAIERRDELHLAVHLGILAVAAVLGFLLGKWFNGLGLAYALLFLVVTAVAMMVILLGTYELACHGHNALIRHWECGPP